MVTIKYAEELSGEFVDTVMDSEAGRRYLMIPLHDYPTFASAMLEYYPKDPLAIRPVNHLEYQFECSEVVDLDYIEQLPSREDGA
ncbi:MAG: hypothetical protein WDN28_18870 [Chthoniobacter sp.]